MKAAELLHKSPRPALVHVLPEQAYAEAHIPGSLNACVYETAFVEKVGALVSDREVEVVVYSEHGETREAEEAAARLAGAGYSRVDVLEGGLRAWKDAGGACEGTGAVAEKVPSGFYALDPSRSLVRWTGRNLLNFHHGSVPVSSGFARIRDGNVEQGEFRVDLRSVKCDDITDDGMNAMLLAHLAGSDFFDTANFPEAVFRTREFVRIPGATIGTPNFLVKGELEMRGRSADLEFSAVVAMADDSAITAQAEFTLDRTTWGSIYGSGRFFSRLAGHVVNDHISLHLRVVLLPTGQAV